MVARRTAVVAAWTLAAAAVLIGAITTWNWQHARNLEAARQKAAQNVLVAGNTSAPDALLSGGDDSAEFTPVPGALHDESEEAAILRVRMQRGSLGALGLPVNEQRATEWIQVDLLVGNDGLPQAVRLAQEQN
jgi:hypothetical protein